MGKSFIFAFLERLFWNKSLRETQGRMAQVPCVCTCHLFYYVVPLVPKGYLQLVLFITHHLFRKFLCSSSDCFGTSLTRKPKCLVCARMSFLLLCRFTHAKGLFPTCHWFRNLSILNTMANTLFLRSREVVLEHAPQKNLTNQDPT